MRMQLLKDVFLLKAEEGVYLAARRGDVVQSRTVVELGRDYFYHRSSGGLHPVDWPSPLLTPAPCGARAVKLGCDLSNQHKSALAKMGDVVLIVAGKGEVGESVDALTLEASDKAADLSPAQPVWQRQRDSSNSIIYPTELATALVSDVGPFIGLALPPPIVQGVRVVRYFNAGVAACLSVVSRVEAREVKADEPQTRVGMAAAEIEKTSNYLSLFAAAGSTGLYVGTWMGVGIAVSASTLSGGVVPAALLIVGAGTAAVNTVSHQVKRRAG